MTLGQQKFARYEASAKWVSLLVKREKLWRHHLVKGRFIADTWCLCGDAWTTQYHFHGCSRSPRIGVEWSWSSRCCRIWQENCVSGHLRSVSDRSKL